MAAPRTTAVLIERRSATVIARSFSRSAPAAAQGLFRSDSRRPHPAEEIRLRRRLADQRVFGTGLPHLSQRGDDQKDHGAQSPAASGATTPCDYYRTA